MPVSFKDVTFSEGAAQVSVDAAEMTEIYEQLAKHNSYSVAELLNGQQVAAGEELKCVILEQSPSGRRWPRDGSGYLMLHLTQRCTSRGRSFLSSPPDDPYEPSRRAGRVGGKRKLPPPRSPSPRLKNGRSDPLWHKDYSLTPGSDAGEEGCTQPVPIRLHRAAAISAAADPTGVACMDILHICGRRNCGVVGHFRPGTAEDNRLDTLYHKSKPGCSRIDHPSLYD